VSYLGLSESLMPVISVTTVEKPCHPNDEAGIKHKNIGVTREDMEVLGVGRVNNKVSLLFSCSIPYYIY
jgi:hypothetical protein